MIVIHPPAVMQEGKGGILNSKIQAEEYFEKIGTGNRNAIRRPMNDMVDRALRRMVEDANTTGDCIVNVGFGYFRPDPKDPVDEKYMNEYLAKELSRARKILLKRMKMRKAYEDMKYVSISNTREA